MNKLLKSLLTLNEIDEFAVGNSVLHRLHALIKLIIVFLFIVFILTTYNFIELVMYLILLFVLGKMGQIPFSKIIKRGMVGLPFSICIGISYLLFNHTMISFYGYMVWEGIILCALVLIKTFLCIAFTYVLISVTTFHDLASELVYIKVPAIFVLQLEMTYRYIFVLLEEAFKMSQAYVLRSGDSAGVDIRHIGSFIGRLLMKSMNEADHVYQGMKCRGFDVKMMYSHATPLKGEDWFLLLMGVGCMVLLKGVFL